MQFDQGFNREQLPSDVLRQSAILYQISIRGETTKQLSREFPEQHCIQKCLGMMLLQMRNIPALLDLITPLLPIQEA
ncbi:hypothetical protein [Allocoleopsis sp.]|uniref:hypothetical protein n=1 Tax=Allocoleopsis sp. TaxID=3088169 RepID=UPI002FD471CC